MVVGKNKRMSKGGKKGGKKKVVDPFVKKEWYDIKAPAMFKTRQVGKTLVTKTIGNKIAADGLKGRVYDCNQDDLMDRKGTGTFRKFGLVCEDVQGKNCILNFHSMRLTRDKLCQMVCKWHTMLNAHIDVKTTDSYHLRLFVVAFTKKDAKQNSTNKTSYAQANQVKQIRKIMVDTITKKVAAGDIKALVKDLLVGSYEQDIEKLAKPIFPLQDVHVSKVKVVKRPKVDLQRLAELHEMGSIKVNAKGEKVERADHYEPAVMDEV